MMTHTRLIVEHAHPLFGQIQVALEVAVEELIFGVARDKEIVVAFFEAGRAIIFIVVRGLLPIDHLYTVGEIVHRVVLERVRHRKGLGEVVHRVVLERVRHREVLGIVVRGVVIDGPVFGVIVVERVRVSRVAHRDISDGDSGCGEGGYG